MGAEALLRTPACRRLRRLCRPAICLSAAVLLPASLRKRRVVGTQVNVIRAPGGETFPAPSFAWLMAFRAESADPKRLRRDCADDVDHRRYLHGRSYLK